MTRKCFICGVMLATTVFLESGVCHECTEKYHLMPHVVEGDFNTTSPSTSTLVTGLSATASPSAAIPEELNGI